MTAFWVSLWIVFVAELGDKSQLMALALATRYRPLPVIAGLTVATAVIHLVSVALGAGLGAALPTFWVTVGAGLAFLGFAAWTLRGDSLDEEAAAGASRWRSAFSVALVAFFLAELGDKTMLATITLAAREEALGTWIGSTLGMVAADVLAIWVGASLGRRLPERTIRYGAAALFAAAGGWLLVGLW